MAHPYRAAPVQFEDHEMQFSQHMKTMDLVRGLCAFLRGLGFACLGVPMVLIVLLVKVLFFCFFFVLVFCASLVSGTPLRVNLTYC